MIERLLARKDICIVAGSGGVGKTTTSAAIALGMAARGKRVAVLTIDPARRLANSLGLTELGNEERRVEVEVKGELWAMMLDAKRTFDDLIEWHAPDEQTRDAVLNNRIYRELSNAVAGSQEYMAMEKLHELHQEGRYDLLVLDTPPTRNALDFLDAPKRLSTFIDSRSLQLFTAPGRFGLKFLGKGTGIVFGAMQRLTGIDLLKDLSDFFQSFSGMTEGFRERAERVNALLADSRTAFLLVTSPRQDSLKEAMFFQHRLLDSGLPFGGVVVNRMHPPLPEGGTEKLKRPLGVELAGKVEANLEDFRRLAERDRANLRGLQARMGRKPMVQVPLLDQEIHDLAGLELMNEYLFAKPVPSS